jgi:protease I
MLFGSFAPAAKRTAGGGSIDLGQSGGGRCGELTMPESPRRSLSWQTALKRLGSGMASILMPLPDEGFDPTETGVPWRTLRQSGHSVAFATRTGGIGRADHRMLTGEGLGILAAVLKADDNGLSAYREMSTSAEFQRPLSYAEARVKDLDGLILPGGHAKSVRPFLESNVLQTIIADFFARGKPVGAVCHGVLLAARSRGPDGKSVLYGKRTTALTKFMELTAWALTCLYLGDYYRTYPTTVEDQVRSALAARADFIRGPMPMVRDSPNRLSVGFTVRDGNYLSARWPGDAHRFASEFASMVAA